MKHIVGFSGGADSQACAGWVLNHYPKSDVVLLNSDAGGNEHPLTTAHILWYSEHVHPVLMVRATLPDLQGIGSKDGGTGERRAALEARLGGDPDALLTFPDLAFVKGRFPSRKAQFCTKILKLEPQKRWIAENMGDEAYIRYAGVRADESLDRKALPERQWDDWFDCELARPLIAWTKLQVFDFLKARGEEVNQLYRLGFSRVGCAPCINSGKDDVRLWASRCPEMIEKVRQWEKDVGRTFFAPCVPGLRINWVDEVVAWSKTLHGGQRICLPFVEAEAEAGTCSSKYGLCE